MSGIRGRADLPPSPGDEYATWDAAYVLGALSDSERREFEVHLHSCPLCHRNVAELAGMPALLGQLSRDEAESIDEYGRVDSGMPQLRPAVLDSLLDDVRHRRRRNRLLAWTGAVAAAAAVVIGLVVAGRLDGVTPAPAPQAESPTMSMTQVAPSPLTATVNLVSHSWGTGIEMNCMYHAEAQDDHDDGDTLAMVAVGRDGSHNRLATWVARSGSVASPIGSTSLPIDQIASVQVISADTGNVLLQRSP
jgi:hypothetical protein